MQQQPTVRVVYLLTGGNAKPYYVNAKSTHQSHDKMYGNSWNCAL